MSQITNEVKNQIKKEEHLQLSHIPMQVRRH